MPYLLAYKAPPVLGEYTRLYPDTPDAHEENKNDDKLMNCPNPLREILKNLLMLEHHMKESAPCISEIIRHAFILEGFCEAALTNANQTSKLTNVLNLLLKYCRKLTQDITSNGYQANGSRWLPEDVKAVYKYVSNQVFGS